MRLRTIAKIALPMEGVPLVDHFMVIKAEVGIASVSNRFLVVNAVPDGCN